MSEGNRMFKVAEKRLGSFNDIVKSNEVIKELLMKLVDRVDTLKELIADLYIKHGGMVEEIHDIKKESKLRFFKIRNAIAERWRFYKLKRQTKKNKKFDKESWEVKPAQIKEEPKGGIYTS